MSIVAYQESHYNLIMSVYWTCMEEEWKQVRVHFYQNVNMHGHGKQYCTVINRNLSTSLVCGKKWSVFLCLLQPSILPSRWERSSVWEPCPASSKVSFEVIVVWDVHYIRRIYVLSPGYTFKHCYRTFVGSTMLERVPSMFDDVCSTFFVVSMKHNKCWSV